MNCIILGDKYKKGMKSKGCAGLIPYGKNTIFHIQYSVIKNNFPNCKIVYVAGFEGKKIQSVIEKSYGDIYFVNNDQYDTKNEIYSLFLSKNFLNDSTLIVSGYNILTDKIFKSFNDRCGSQVFVSEGNDSDIGCTISDNQVLNIDFGLDNHISDIYYIQDSHINFFKHMIENKIYHNYFLFELINKMIDQNLHIKPFYNTIKKKYGYSK